jgi:hypothetical protein
MNYTNEQIERLLDGKRFNGEEDLLILQADGTRVCAGWELTNGFHLVDNSGRKEKKELSDKELLESAYRQLGRRK